MLGGAPVVFAASPHMPRTLKSAIIAAELNPGRDIRISAGKGTLPHVAAERLKQVAGAPITHVPYMVFGRQPRGTFFMRTTLKALRQFVAVPLPATGLHASAKPPPPAYGPAITTEQTKNTLVAAEAEARKNGGQVMISVVDTGGHLVMLQRLHAQNASFDIATSKATTAVNLRRQTSALESSLATNGGALQLLAVPGAMPLQGGPPIVVDGKIIGRNRGSGGPAAQDEMVAKAGLDGLLAKWPHGWLQRALAERLMPIASSLMKPLRETPHQGRQWPPATTVRSCTISSAPNCLAARFSSAR